MFIIGRPSFVHEDSRFNQYFSKLIQSIELAISSSSNVFLWDAATVTWADVYTAIQASKTPLLVILQRKSGDPQFDIPSGTYETNHSIFIVTDITSQANYEITLEDGAQLRNIGQFTGPMAIFGNSTSLPCIVNVPFDNSSPAIYVFTEGVFLQNNGTAPMVAVPDNSFAVFASIVSGGILTPSVSPVIGIGNNSFLLFESFDGLMSFNSNSISGPGTATFVLAHNGNVNSNGNTLPVFTTFSGTVVNSPFGTNGGSGKGTAAPGVSGRPISFFGGLEIGCSYFDVDLGATGLPIWFDNNGTTGWANASGIPV